MRSIVTATRFERDLKRAKKRGKNLDKLFEIVDRLCADEPIEARHRPHALTGSWKPFWDLHIEPDWLLRKRFISTELEVMQTSSVDVIKLSTGFMSNSTL